MGDEIKRKNKQIILINDENNDYMSDNEEQLLEKQERQAEIESENDYFRETIFIIKTEIFKYVNDNSLTLCEYLTNERDLENFLHSVKQ